MENIIDFEVDKNSDSYKIFKDIKKQLIHSQITEKFLYYAVISQI